MCVLLHLVQRWIFDDVALRVTIQYAYPDGFALLTLNANRKWPSADTRSCGFHRVAEGTFVKFL